MIDTMEPYFYQLLNEANSAGDPSTVHSKNTMLTRYFQRYLLQKVRSVIVLNGVPEEWDEDYVFWNLLIRGHLAIVQTKEFGVIPQENGFYGQNIFYRPRGVLVTNPLISETIRAEIGTEAALVALTPEWRGIFDIVSYYANKMALISDSFDINVVNARLAQVFGAENEAQAQAFRKMYDQIIAGQPGVFIDKKLFRTETGELSWTQFIQNLTQNYIGSTLLGDLKGVENEFCAEVGIPNSNYEKEAHVLNAEVNANNSDTQTKLQLWIDELNKGFGVANRLFGLNLSASARFEELLTVENDEGNEDEEVEEDDQFNA